MSRRSWVFRRGKAVLNLALAIISTLLFVLYPDSTALAISKLECNGAAVAELFIPGLGHAILGQYDKSITLGGSRWIFSSKYRNAVESEYYQEDPDEIYRYTEKENTTTGKSKYEFHYNKETWEAHYYGSLYSDFVLISWADIYRSGCGEKSSDTYSMMLAPLRFSHFYDKLSFWIPMAVAAYAYNSMSSDMDIEYHLGRGLTRSDLRRDSFPLYYTVGVGEEMLFRGVFQDYLYSEFQDGMGFSAETSRHLAVWAGAAIFGAAHNGVGTSANAASAFLMGAYLGYVYQPSADEFDLTTAIAIHSWWDIIIAYAYLNNASYTESASDVSIPLVNIGFMF